MRLRTSSLRLAAGTALLLVAGLLGLAGPATAATTVTSFSFTSDAGDYIGQGGSRSFDPSNATFSIQGTAANLTVSIQSPSEYWSANLAAPAGAQLAPGTYSNAARAAFSGTSPGLDVSGAGRGCNTDSGSFTLTALTADSHGQVTALDATFVQHCEGATPALRGTVRYAAPSSAIELTSAASTVVEGTPVTLSAQVPPGTSTTVTFRDGSTVLGSNSAANNGLAKWSVPSPSVGTHTYTASQNASQVSSPATVTVLPGTTSMSYSSVRGEYIGQGATAAFAAPSASIAATGSATGLTVAVTEGSEWWYVTLAPVAGQSLTTGTYPAAERASFRTAGHPGLDVYGDGRGCNTVTGSFTVNRIAFAADGSVSVLDATWSQNCEGGAYAMDGRVRVNVPAATTTSLSATSAAGGQTTLTATVSAATGTPGGSVTFTDGSTALGTGTLDSAGRATLTTGLARGAHTLTAAYGGSQGYAASQSSASLTVLGYATSTSLTTTARGQVKVGRPLTFPVTVTGGPTPTGTVALFDASTQVATGDLSAGAATLTWAPPTKGTHTLTARYAGDPTHEPSTSAPLTLKVG